MQIHKVTIIGGGPAGLTAAIYCARAGLNPLVVAGRTEGTAISGGQLMTTTEVENYPGFPEGISGPELVTRMTEQAQKFGARIVEEWASNINGTGPFNLKVGEEIHQTDAIIIATGAHAKWLELPNEGKYKNNGLSACATCDGPLPYFRNKHLHVIGGGDSAMEEALFLTKFAKKVTVVYRGSEKQMRASAIMRERADSHQKIEFLLNSEIVEYIGENSLEALKIKSNGVETVHTTGGVFMAIGHTPDTHFLDNILALQNNGYIATHDHVYTSVKGIFTCGDVHDSEYRQAITAAGFGCMAAIAATRWLETR